MPHICVESITKTTALFERGLYLVGILRLVSINLSEWGTRQYWLLYMVGGWVGGWVGGGNARY